MIRLCVIAWLFAASMVSAQSLAENGVISPEPVTQDISAVIPVGDLDIAVWDSLASRAETIAETGSASRFALTRIRSELIVWRDVFADAAGANADRLATVAAQLDALGPAPEGDAVFSPIETRRNALENLQKRLRQPKVLAQEAFARANGLITEIDRQRRASETERLLTRDQSPANPNAWPTAVTALRTAISSIGQETWSISGAFAIAGDLLPRLALVVVALLAAGFVLSHVRSWVAEVARRPVSSSERATALYQFMLSAAGVVIPFVGLVLVVTILTQSELFGVPGTAVLSVLPMAGGAIFTAKWLADAYFPQSQDQDGILGYGHDTRIRARQVTVWLGWALAALLMIDAIMATGDPETVAIAVVNLPFQLFAGALLWRLGGLIARHSRQGTSAIFTRSRLRKFIGRAAQTIAVVGPLASVLGYSAAANAMTVPAVISLAVLATIVILQRLSYDIASPQGAVQTDEPDPKGLLPVTINFVLAIACIPVLALIWGVSVAELQEVWTRFLAGFKIGETQISPSNFLTFIVVFMLGVLITRFIKTTLKTTVMPRTRFDLGGQNAVVAGFGYVGIFLSALVAFGVAGIDLSSLAIVAGALSVGIGFGLQNIVSNFVSGIILLIERPIGEGDMIEVGGQMGYVRDISVRSTRIETFDRTDVIVPNADLVSNQVTNWTRGNSVGRAIVPVGVAYGTDTTKVMAILQEIADAHPLVLINPPPSVLLMGFGADSIDFEIRAIIRDVNFVMVVKSEMLQAINTAFSDAGIEIPFAQRDLWLRNPETIFPKHGEDT